MGFMSIPKKDGTILQLSDFIEILEKPTIHGEEEVERIVREVHQMSGKESLPDDVSILQAIF